MGTASVLIPAETVVPAAPTAAPSAPVPRYTLLLSDDGAMVDAAQRLRHDVFAAEPGYTYRGVDGRDADRFDEFCDHLLVREDTSGELVGCYRMLPPSGAVAAGSLYSATEFDTSALAPLAPSLVEMGRAVVRADHRHGAVVLLMWAGILAYLDHRGHDFVTGCVSVPVDGGEPDERPGSRLRGVRDVVRRRHAAPSAWTVRPLRPVVIDGRGLDDIAPPARVSIPPLMRGYLRLGAQICGEPAHDPAFGVGDFPALLDKRRADVRYLTRLRSVGQAAALAGGAAR